LTQFGLISIIIGRNWIFLIPIVEGYEMVLSEYILKEQNKINLVEVGYFVYYTDVLALKKWGRHPFIPAYF